jgi:DHA2 family multidrug resistance protein
MSEAEAMPPGEATPVLPGAAKPILPGKAKAKPYLPRSPAGDYNVWMVAFMLSIAPFMEVLDTTIATVSLAHIGGSLAASQEESTWILTSYLVANSLILPISGWLQKVVGRKLFYLICVAGFTLSSVGCAFSTSLSMMLVFRVLQGLGGGGLAPVTQSMLADSVVPQKRAQIFTVLGLTIVAAPATGPFVGGWITDHLSWHWIFLINLPVGLIAGTLVAIFTSEPKLLVEERRALLKAGLKLDYLGLALVAIGFGCLQIFLDKFPEDDGFSSSFIVAMFCIWVSALSLLVVWELQHPQPVMNFRLLKYRNFAIGNIIMFMMSVVFFASTQLLPQLTQSLLGYTSENAGDVLALGGLLTFCMMPVAGFTSGRFVQPKFLLLAAFAEMGVALFLQAGMTLDVSFDTIAAFRTLQVIAVPFIFVPLTALCYVGLPPKNNGEASALMNQMRNLGSSFGVSAIGTALAWRTQFHHARLTESITPYSSLHGMTASQIAPLVQTQAVFMSYIDLFRIAGIVALFVIPIVLLLKSPPKMGAQGASVGH